VAQCVVRVVVGVAVVVVVAAIVGLLNGLRGGANGGTEVVCDHVAHRPVKLGLHQVDVAVLAGQIRDTQIERAEETVCERPTETALQTAAIGLIPAVATVVAAVEVLAQPLVLIEDFGIPACTAAHAALESQAGGELLFEEGVAIVAHPRMLRA
jgi:hypothetical protein